MREAGLSIMHRTVSELQKRQQLILRGTLEYTLQFKYVLNGVARARLRSPHWLVIGGRQTRTPADLSDLWKRGVSPPDLSGTEDLSSQRTSGGMTRHPPRNPIHRIYSYAQTALRFANVLTSKKVNNIWQLYEDSYLSKFFLYRMSWFPYQLQADCKLPQSCLWAHHGGTNKGPTGMALTTQL